MMEPNRILIIEDEAPLARFLQLELEHEGFHVTVVHDGERGLELALAERFDTIVLDRMLPRMDGVEVCRRLRRDKTTPVIMLTARASVRDRVEGLDCGADDYVTKPFAIEEVIARIRSIQRRTAETVKTVFRIHDLELDPDAHLVTRAGQTIELSTREYDLLKYMFEHREVVLNRETLLQHVWGFSFAGGTNVVDVYIRYLRAKIDDPHEVKLIHTVRGYGYVLRDKS